MTRLKNYLVNKHLLLIFILYFSLRLTNLTLLPIFNDEAIYLDWGWRETHIPGALYYSLYDGKQPLLMWLFGISETIFIDPLFAGRIISVFTGAFTLLGLYLITKILFNKKAAVISALLYIFVPIFMFFDRQALMESAIAAVGVISCYFLVRTADTNAQKYSYWLGIILGIGFFIKSSGLLFIITYFILSFLVLFKSERKMENIKHSTIVISMILITTFLLLINPQFWSTLPKNISYSFTIGELLRFPLHSWIKNAKSDIIISFFYFTPFIFSLSLAGLYLILKTKKRINLLFILWITIPLLLQIISARITNQRYLVSYLPLLLIPAAYFFQTILEKKRLIGLFLLSFSLFLPSMFTFFLIFSPPLYFSMMGKMNSHSENGYLTSGYGIVEVKNYLEKISENNKTFVGLALNTGNPESAMLVYFRKNDRIKAGYFDSRQFEVDLNKIDCFKLPVKFYFVSRDEQQAGLNKFFSKIKSFKNPYSNSSIGIYTIKEPCYGKTLYINL